jgi:hypothetical protein
MVAPVTMPAAASYSSMLLASSDKNRTGTNADPATARSSQFSPSPELPSYLLNAYPFNESEIEVINSAPFNAEVTAASSYVNLLPDLEMRYFEDHSNDITLGILSLSISSVLFISSNKNKHNRDVHTGLIVGGIIFGCAGIYQVVSDYEKKEDPSSPKMQFLKKYDHVKAFNRIASFYNAAVSSAQEQANAAAAEAAKNDLESKKDLYARSERSINSLNNLDKEFISDNSKIKLDALLAELKALSIPDQSKTKASLSSSVGIAEKSVAKLKITCSNESIRAKKYKTWLDYLVNRYAYEPCIDYEESLRIQFELRDSFKAAVAKADYSAFWALCEKRRAPLPDFDARHAELRAVAKNFEGFVQFKKSKLSPQDYKWYMDQVSKLNEAAEAGNDVSAEAKKLMKALNYSVKDYTFAGYFMSKYAKNDPSVGYRPCIFGRESLPNGDEVLEIAKTFYNKFGEVAGTKYFKEKVRYVKTPGNEHWELVERSEERSKSTFDGYMDIAKDIVKKYFEAYRIINGWALPFEEK